MKVRRLLPLLALAAFPLTPARADLSGFGTNGTGFTLIQGQTSNGLSVSNDIATLTSGVTSQGNAIFSNTKQNYGAFKVSFTYQDVNPPVGGSADGFTFTLQNDTRTLSTVVGGTGNSLGYANGGGTTAHAAISPSVAVGFNIYNSSTTGVATNGALTLNNASVLTNTSLAVLGSGNPINITLTYNGTTLTETLTDTVLPTNTSTFNYTINLANTLGSSGMAYVGFTGATGASVATQRISNFSYTVVPEPSTWAAGGLTVLAGVAVLRRRKRLVSE